MPDLLDTLLLLALPASGKSEVRTFLAHRAPDECRDRFHVGPTVQLDDYPYVHAMRRIDDESVRRGLPRVFFQGDGRPFRDARDWLTLAGLVDGDWHALHRPVPPPARHAARALFDRIDAAGIGAGIPARLGALPERDRAALAAALENESRTILDDLAAAVPDSLDGRTIVVEFSRGGPEGAAMPLPGPLGYRASLAHLSPALLERAVVLYLDVTPGQSRARNVARTDPDDPGSILNHGVPEIVMRHDYGCDDFAWMAGNSTVPGTIEVVREGRTFRLPAVRFDNRGDRTTFVRSPAASWPGDRVAELERALRDAMGTLAEACRRGVSPTA